MASFAVAAGDPRRACVVRPPGLEDQDRERGRELGRGQLVPQPVPQRLGGQQVDVGVDPHQVPAALGDGVAVEVLQRDEHLADPVELPGHGVRALLDPATQRLRVAVELEPALAPAGVVLTVGALVAGVRLELGPEPVDLLVGDRPGRSRAPLAVVAGGRRRGQVVRPRPQCGRQVTPHLRVAAVEVARHLQPRHRGHRRREVDRRQPSGLPLRGHDVGSRLVPGEAGVDDDREPGELPGRYVDHVARLEPGQRVEHLLAPVGPARPRGLLLQVGDPAPERGVLHEVAEVAGRGLAVAVERVLALAQLPGQPDHGLVGLELREGLLQQVPRPLAAELVDQVDGHVVRRAERRPERVGAGGRQAGQLARVHPRLPQHHPVPLDVEAPAAGPAGELGVLPRRDVGMGLAVPLGQLLDHDRAGGHVDAEREGLGREHHLAEAADEELLHALLERRQHARVVRRDPAGQAVEEVVVAQHVQVVVGQVPAALLDERVDLVPLVRPGQAYAGGQALRDRGVAADPAEDEDDRRQQPFAVQPVDDVDPAGDPDAAAVADAARVLRGAGLALPRRPAVAHQPAAGEVVAGDPDQLVVDRGALLHEAGRRVDVGAREQVVHPAADHDVLVERDRPLLLDDGGGVPADRLQPLAELLGVGHGRGQRDQGHRLGQVDDDLLPHRTPVTVGEVVHLVHHHVAEAQQRPGPGVQHVPQDLGGHHDHRRLAVHAVVAGEQPDLVLAVAGHEVVELLVGQRLDRRRVERLAPGREREVDRELADDRLAGAGGRGHQDPAPVLDLLAGPDLEVVEREVVVAAEVPEHGVAAAAPVVGVPLGRAAVVGVRQGRSALLVRTRWSSAAPRTARRRRTRRCRGRPPSRYARGGARTAGG